MSTTIIVTPSTPAGDPFSHYGVLADLYSKAGTRNVWTYADLEAESPDVLSDDSKARIQVEMLQADAEIDYYLDTNGQGTQVSSGAFGFALLNEAWRYLTISKLYSARGDRDFVLTDVVGNERPISTKSGDWERRAKTLLARYVIGKRRNITTSIAFTGNNRFWHFPCG